MGLNPADARTQFLLRCTISRKCGSHTIFFTQLRSLYTRSVFSSITRLLFNSLTVAENVGVPIDGRTRIYDEGI